VKRGFIKGEALRLLRANSSKTTFEDSISNFKSRLAARRYDEKMIHTTLSEVHFKNRQSALQQKQKSKKQILPFVTTYHPSVRNLKNILMSNWDLIKNQPLLNSIFKDPPLYPTKEANLLKTCSLELKYEGNVQFHHIAWGVRVGLNSMLARCGTGHVDLHEILTA